MTQTTDTILKLHNAGAHIVLTRDKAAFKSNWQHRPESADSIRSHDAEYGLIPASLKLACIDFDAGDPQWLIDILTANGIPYAKVRTRRGWHLYVKVHSTDGIDRDWQNEHGKGEVRCVARQCRLWDAAAVLALCRAADKTCEAAFFALLAPARAEYIGNATDSELVSAIVAEMRIQNPQATVSTGWLNNCYCPNPEHNDSNPGVGVSLDSGVIACTTCGNPSPVQAAAWLGIQVSTPTEATQCQYKLRSLMLGVWEATAVALIEGTARIYEQTGELPRNEPELLMALGSVGIPLNRTTVGRYRVEAAWLCSYLTPSGNSHSASLTHSENSQCSNLTPNTEPIGIRYEHLYREWEIGVLRELSDMLSLKQARLKINAGDTVGGDIIESLLGVKFEQMRITPVWTAEPVEHGHALLTPIELPEMLIHNGTAYRAAFARAYFERQGEHSLSKWQKILGCSANTAKATLRNAGIHRTVREPIKVGVCSTREVSANWPDKAAIICIERQGTPLVFNKGMTIQDGDIAVYQPICEHIVVADADATPKPRIKPEPTNEPTDDRILAADYPTPEPVINNMERPTDKWRGLTVEPALIYWAALRILEVKGWRIDEDRQLLIYKSTGEVEVNPTLDRVLATVRNIPDCKPLAMEVDPLALAAIVDLGAVLAE